MALQKVANWFLTDRGRHFSLYLATTATVGTFFVKALPHTLLIDYYRDFVHLYKTGLTVPVPETLKIRFEKAIELADIPEEERKLYKPFMVYGFDIFSIGTGYSKFGCKIGMPKNFTYTDVDSIDKSMIKISNESVTWSLDEGKQLLNSFVLSEKAQLYAIAREIKMLQSPKFLLDCTYPTVSLMGLYGFSQFFNRKQNLYAKPLAVRLIMYGLVAAFVFGNYIFAHDFTQMHFEKKVDEYLRNKDEIFIQGGKEFYEKILNRNVALRKLMGKVGENKFSVLGNENYLLRQRHVPLIQRKEFFEEKSDYN